MRVIGGEGYAYLRTGSIVEPSLLPIQSFYEPKVALKKNVLQLSKGRKCHALSLLDLFLGL